MEQLSIGSAKQFCLASLTEMCSDVQQQCNQNWKTAGHLATNQSTAVGIEETGVLDRTHSDHSDQVCCCVNLFLYNQNRGKF